MTRRAGRSLLQVPGPTNVPDQVLHALAAPTIDHRGEEFAGIARLVLSDLKRVFGTSGAVALYPGSGTGGWEAALVNTLSGGDKVLICESGFFAASWARMAGQLGLEVIAIPTDWRRPTDITAIAEALLQDVSHDIQAVLVVHNETSSGATSDVAAVRRVLDEADHPALLLVDTVSSLASIPVLHDAWRVDVTVAASQKGLMLPPGLAILAISDKALGAKSTASLPCSYWDWNPMVEANQTGSFPYTPATNLVVALHTALQMLFDEGIEAVYQRHRRHAGAVRAAVQHWGLDFVCTDPQARSNSVTAFMLPGPTTDPEIRALLLERFNVTIGGGLGRLEGRCIRIGHMGDLDDLMVISCLSALEIGLTACSVPIDKGGLDAAIEQLTN